MSRAGHGLCVIFLLLAPADTGSAQDKPAKSKYGTLVDEPGAGVTYAFCIACHSEKIIAQQGLSREDWDEMLDWMTEEQGMTQPPEEFRNQILDYLSANYNIDRPNFRQPAAAWTKPRLNNANSRQ